ncbi:MAG TPA: EamA family transporter [Candidatus Limnocylindrales bacterium]
MSSLALVLVLVAAGLHVAWNVVIKTAGDPLRRSAVAMAASAIVLVPLAIVGWLTIGRPPVPPESFVLGAVSGVLEAIYFALLSAAYRRGDLSLVYPIARGTAPLLAVAVGVLVLGERLGSIGAVGVGLLLVGLLGLQRPWRFVRAGLATGEGPAVAFAALTGCSIAAYSAVDRVGARTTEPWIYGAILFAVGAVVLAAWTMWRGAADASDDDRPDGRRRELALGVLGGILALAAYLLVLGAYTLAPLSAVAPLRESAIVVASAWGTLRMREARGAHALGRLAAAALVVGGAILLALEASG